MSTQQQVQEEDFSGRFSLAAWKGVYRYALPYKRIIAGLGVAAIAIAAGEASFTLMTRGIIDDVVSNGGAYLWHYAAGYAVLGLLFSLSVMSFIMLAGKLSTHVSHDIRQAGFSKLQDLSFGYFDRRPVGWLVTRLTSDCDRLSRTISWGAMDIAWGTCLVTGISIIMLIINWRLALVVLSMLPVMAWVSMFFQKRILATSRAARKQNSAITAAFSEAIQGVRTTKTLVRERENLGEFGAQTGKMYELSFHNALLSAIYWPLILTLGAAGAGLALWRGGVTAMEGRLSPGTLVLFISYAGSLIWPILEMARVFADLQAAQAAAERVLGLINTDPDIKDTPEALARIEAWRGYGPKKGIADDGLPSRIETIDFQNVSFAYKGGQQVLSDFSLSVQAGQTVALVGPTGGGKTTIVSLMCRFYEPTAGRILINGVDYRHRSLHWLQSNLGIVLQQPHLFNGTVRENIRYGRLEASDAEVEAAAMVVRAHDFIVNLEKGYETNVGEGGNKLSTGQKQLVSFARAVLADPQIFVMDEATSSVDTRTEQLIQEGLRAVLSGRTSFIIAHRLSTIRAADVILVIEDGRIVEQGNHRELIGLRGRYFDLYTNQFAEEQTTAVLAGQE